MKKTSLLLSSCILFTIANSALAMDIRGERTSFFERNKPKPVGFNYTYLESSYLYSTSENTDGDTNSVQSLDAKASFMLSKQFSASLEYNGSAYTYNNDFVTSSELLIGVNYHYSLSKTADIYSEIKIINIDVEVPNSTQSVSLSGSSISIGLRHRISPTLEWGVSALHYDIDSTTYSKGRIQMSYGSDRETQYITGYERSNTSDKQQSISFGIRFNF